MHQTLVQQYPADVVVFNDARILTTKVNSRPYAALKPIVEGMGLAWQPQHRKIVDSPRYSHMVIPLETSGGVQETLCLPLDRLNGWLFSVNPEKCREDIRETVRMYQEECFSVLYEYFHVGYAANPRAFEEKPVNGEFESRERQKLIEMQKELLDARRELIAYQKAEIEKLKKHPPKRKRLTEAEKQTIFTLREQGRSYSEIAAAVGRVRETVRSFLGRVRRHEEVRP